MAKEPITCEYLVDGRLCKAISQQPEGKDVRKKFCTNDPKNYCCYLCSIRENCEISCTYLEGSRKQWSLDASESSRIEAKLKKYQEEKAKLSVLLADGKIGEKSYLAATSTLDHRIDELKKIEENPMPFLTPSGTSFQPSEFEGLTDQEHAEKPTPLWYLVPLFFGIIGGIVGYVGTKNEDEDMAANLLFLGILVTIILVIIYIYELSFILSHL